jgi:quinol monooxygenase YgiN
MPNLVVMAQISAQPGAGDALVDAVKPYLAWYRDSGAGLARSCYRSIDDTDRFAVYAEYSSAEAVAAQQLSSEFTILSQTVRPLIGHITWARYANNEPDPPGAPSAQVAGLVVIGQSRVQPGMADVVKAGQARTSAAVRASEPRCLRFTHYQSIDDPDLIAVYEQYVDADGFAAHQQSAHFKVAMATNGPLLVETVWSRYEELKGE